MILKIEYNIYELKETFDIYFLIYLNTINLQDIYYGKKSKSNKFINSSRWIPRSDHSGCRNIWFIGLFRAKKIGHRIHCARSYPRAGRADQGNQIIFRLPAGHRGGRNISLRRKVLSALLKYGRPYCLKKGSPDFYWEFLGKKIYAGGWILEKVSQGSGSSGLNEWVCLTSGF